MALFKNVASQKVALFAFVASTGLPKTGDAANFTVYVSKDHGAVTVLSDITATELDATNAKGVYVFDLTQAETNANTLIFTGKSSTSDVAVVVRFIDTLADDLTATMKASVNAEVVDALNVDTYPEPGQEVPPATTSLVKKIGYGYKAWRNKLTQTSSEYKLFADNGTTVDQKATVGDDGTTLTVGEKATGP